MVSALGRANYGLVAVAFGLYMLSILFWAGRWRISLSAIGYRRRLRDLYLVIFGGIFITNITPFTYAGGDPLARGYLLNKTQRVPYSTGFATILVELMLDLPIFFTFLMIGLLLSIYATSIAIAIFLIGIWLVTVVTLLSIFSRIVSSKAGSERLKRFLTRVFRTFRRRTKRAKIAAGVDDFYAGAHAIIGRPRIAVLVGSFSIILWLFGMARLFFIFQAFNYSPPIPMLLLAVTLPAIVGLLPLLPGGLGTVDVTIASVFLLFGVPLEIAGSVVLIERFIVLVFGTLVGAGIASYLGVRTWRGIKIGE
jgi:hypothetical protein